MWWLLSVWGCGAPALESNPAPGAAAQPVTIEVAPPSSGRTTLAVKQGSATWKGEVYGYQDTVTIRLEGMPARTRVAAGTKEQLVDSSGYLLMEVPVRDRMGGFTVAELESFDPAFNLVITLPDGGKGEVKAPTVSLSYGVTDLLKGVENGPVTFGTEPPDAALEDSLFWPGALMGEEWIGKKGKLAEVDRVAVDRALPEEKGTRLCTGYKDNKDQPAPDLTISLKENEVTVYDRRTGASLATRVFPPDDRCPTMTFRAEGDNTQDSQKPWSAIGAWLRTQIKR